MRIVYDLYKLTRIFYRKLDIVFSSFFMQIFIKNSNVHAGRGVKFVGKTTILSATGSCLSIGSNCEFLSRSTANLIGINRPCILTTMNKNAKLIIGNIDIQNRDRNLILFQKLLNEIVKKWPDVEFISSDELGKNIVSKYDKE